MLGEQAPLLRGLNLGRGLQQYWACAGPTRPRADTASCPRFFNLPFEHPDSSNLDVSAPLAVDVAFDVVPATFVTIVAAGIAVDVA